MNDSAAHETLLFQKALHRDIVCVGIRAEILQKIIAEFYAGVSDALHRAIIADDIAVLRNLNT